MNAFLFYGTVNLLTKLLPRRACYAIARRASGLAYRHNHAVRSALAANLRVVLDGRGTAWSEPELEQLVRRNFANFGNYVVDFFQMGRLSPHALDAVLEVEHIEYLEQCRTMRMGIIGLTAHVGNWELGAAALERHGCRVNAVVLKQSSARLDRLFQMQRIRRGVNPLPMDNAAVSVPACLMRNELVVFLADLNFSRGGGRRALLFGKPAQLPRGPAILAKRTGAPIVPAFVLRHPDDTFCFRVYPPILSDRSPSVDDIQRRICAVLEEVIAAHPDQWFAFEPLWA
jgi:lauroyl/myristoyl acyltransferase